MKKALLALVLIAAVAIAFWSSTELQNQFNEASSAVSAYVAEHRIMGVVVFLFFAALSAVLSPFTSTPIIPFAVNAWGEFMVFVFLVLGWFLGSILSYSLGKYGIAPYFGHLLPFKKAEEYQRRLEEHSKFFLVVLFRLALPSEISGLVLGSLRYDFYKYLAATLISEIPFAIIAVYMGGAIAMDNPIQFALWTIGGAIFIGVVASIFFISVRFYK